MLESENVSVLIYFISCKSLCHLLLGQPILQVYEKRLCPKVKYHCHCKAKRCSKENLVERVGAEGHHAKRVTAKEKDKECGPYIVDNSPQRDTFSKITSMVTVECPV